MISFFANLFGYVLNFLYEIVDNYGFAIILFSILVKVIMLPISIKQQKTMQKSQELNNEMKQIQFKYKNDPEKANQEIMALYKREKLSPFSGCFSAIVQLILLFSVFFLVRSPLTYMKKVDSDLIEKLGAVVQEDGKTTNYKEIAIINYVNNFEEQKTVNVQEKSKEEDQINEDEENTNNEQQNQETDNEINETVENTEIQEQQEESQNEEEINIDEYKEKVYINMDFLGLDLSKVPTEDLEDLKVLIIPALYVVSSFISMKLSTKNSKPKEDKNLIGDGNKDNEEKDEYDAMAEANKTMSWVMPLMSISIACIAPLGLALYWLMNNILMICERSILNKFLKKQN